MDWVVHSDFSLVCFVGKQWKAWLCGSKMVKLQMNCGIDSVPNSAGDPSLLYTTSWGKRNLCLMEELPLCALPDLMCLLHLESLRG